MTECRELTKEEVIDTMSSKFPLISNYLNRDSDLVARVIVKEVEKINSQQVFATYESREQTALNNLIRYALEHAVIDPSVDDSKMREMRKEYLGGLNHLGEIIQDGVIKVK